MKPLSPNTAPTEMAMKAASRWLVRHENGLSPTDQAGFEGWLAANPDHALAWRQVTSTARFLAQIKRDDTIVAAMLSELARRSRRRIRKIVAGTGLALAAAAMLLVMLHMPAPEAKTGIVLAAESPPTPAISAPPALPGSASILTKAKRELLADGSQIELNDGASVRVRYTTAHREVTLLAGEALFTVAKDITRPFVVRTGEVEVRAVGTAFAVQLAANGIDVLVTEGSVAVSHVENPADPQAAKVAPFVVGAGNLLVMPSNSDPAVPPALQVLSTDGIRRRLAWTRPRLQLSNTPLAEAVAVLNRQNAGQITIVDRVLARLRLTGSFMADDAEGFVRLLEAHYDVKVEADDNGNLRLGSQ